DDGDDDHAPPAPAHYLVAHDEDPAEAYAAASEEDSQLELLREGMAALDARSRDIIRRRWLDADSKVTLQELADEYGVSAERIRQVEANALRSEEHTSELQSRENLVCRLLLEKKKDRNK